MGIVEVLSFFKSYGNYSIKYWKLITKNPQNFALSVVGGSILGLTFTNGETSYIIDPTPEEWDYIAEGNKLGLGFGALLGPCLPIVPLLATGMAMYSIYEQNNVGDNI